MLISCLCPTRDRRPYIPLAIRAFQNQTYPNRELLILDDGDDPVLDLIPNDPRIVYTRGAQPPRTLGAKLNALALTAHGQICCNWDDDDWSSPDRLAHQYQTLIRSQKQVTGFNAIFYWDTTTSRAHIWRWWGSKLYSCGSSHFYFTDWILRNPMPDKTHCVDFDFSMHAEHNRQLTPESGLPYLVARYHHHSAWTKPLSKSGYKPVAKTSLPPQFFMDAGIT
jgi:glycosyltransferase involved in cell wall biosynthesis